MKTPAPVPVSKKPRISGAYRLLELAVRAMGFKRIFDLDEQELKAYIKKNLNKQKTAPPGFIYRKYRVREWMVDQRPCYIISPQEGVRPQVPLKRDTAELKPPVPKTLLFLHGGGMIMEAHLIHWIVISKMISCLGVTVWVPVYPLAPHGFREITEKLFPVYEKMLEENPGSEVTVLGDSAGGTLALILCHHNKARGMPLPMPHKLILVSPGVFARKDNRTIRDEMDRILPRDPVLSPRLMDILISWMVAAPDRGSYFEMPTEADFSGFPGTYVFFGTREIFYAAASPFIERLRSAGVPVKVYLGEGMMHIWPYMPVSRESREALKIIFAIIEGKG
ncbi:alpha/beta hydrolase [Treponema sp. TIM-1]|uniref:alpha/beta hydrolase fold domain-containing protein n=1 Tax=Treponema sp. TIM-1 TaxID=2898417 RepID=UPI00397EC76C